MFKSKVYRLFCFLFSFSLVFATFGVEASAASDNLISSDLTTWTNLSDLNTSAYPVSVTTAADIYRVTLVDQGFSDYQYPSYLGAVLDHTSLIAGHSYSLSFKMPTLSEINSAFNKDYSQSTLNNHFKNSNIKIGVCFISPSGVFNIPEEYILFEITSDNYTNFFGKNLNASFIASSYSGTPVVTIMITSLDGTDHSFYFSNFKLVDNDDNSAELTGIKGFLHSIRWDLVGGVCSEDDCPHSSSDNPHLSLTERMSSGFASMFQSIGDKFEEGSTLNTWFTNLANKVGNVDSSISDLGDREEGFFGSLGDRISGFFSDLKTNMSNWFSELGNKITTKFQEIGDNFSEFFDKFKPRVSFDLTWSRGAINSSGVVIDHSNEHDYKYVIVSEAFEIPSGYSYYLDYIDSTETVSVSIYQYDINGNYLKMNTISTSSEGYILEGGYEYRFSSRYTLGVEDLSVMNDYVIVYAEEGWVNALLYKAKIGLRSLFVPDEAFIATWKEEMDTELEAHLGFLYQIPDFTISYMQVIRNTLKDNDTIEFTFPKIEFEFNGEKIHLWDAIQVDFSFLEKEPFSTIYSFYKVGIIIIFGAALFMYGKHVWKKVMAN